MTLLPRHYSDGDVFQQEKRTLFANAWLPLAVLPQLDEPGRYVSASIGGWPLFAVQGADGTARAFRNVCRHKGMLVVGADGGQCDLLRCRFHGWTYGLDGRFVTAPVRVAPTDGEDADRHLTAIALALWREVLLVNLRTDAACDDLGALDAYLKAGSADDCTQYLASSGTNIDCNWKTYLEHFVTDSAAGWHWPLLGAKITGGALTIVQIIPRTFLRSRVIRHRFVRPGADAPDASAGDRGRDEAAVCEALQAARMAGVAADLTNPHVAELHCWLADAYSVS